MSVLWMQWCGVLLGGAVLGGNILLPSLYDPLRVSHHGGMPDGIRRFFAPVIAVFAFALGLLVAAFMEPGTYKITTVNPTN